MADPLLLALAAVLILQVFVLVLMLRSRRRDEGVDSEALASKLTQSMASSGLFEQVGRLDHMAGEMVRASQQLEGLFRLRPERGAVGEFQLEEILKDLLPHARVAIRTNIPGVGTPDAAIKTNRGLLLVDSKFPLEAYRDVANATDASTRESAARRFRQALRGHVADVGGKYVNTAAGTLPFAILFIPSEAVFATAIDQDPALVREAAAKGVVLASPTTLASHLQIVAAGLRAEQLSRTAERVQGALAALEKRFGDVRSEWETMARHVGNANAKASDVARRLDSLEAAWRAAASRSLEDREE
jgi:DNA recombination protein RmuC